MKILKQHSKYRTLSSKVFPALLSFVVCTFLSIPFLCADNVPFNKPIMVEDLLKKQWALSEIMRTKKDTITNLTVFLLPCEKDNFTEYLQEGTYKIFDGNSRCSASSEAVIGAGTWELDKSDKSIIIETYQGGREIEKKIVELSETTYVVEFESEGNSITRLTYFSKKALEEDSELASKVEDPNNHSQTLTKMVREILVSKGRYVLVSKNDFEGNTPIEVNTRNGLYKTVVVYPFADATNENQTLDEFELEDALLKRAKSKGIDYIVTGTLLKKEVEERDGKYQGGVKYSVKVLDGSSGTPAGVGEFEQKKSSGNSGDLLKLVMFASILNHGYYWGSYYDYYFLNRTVKAADDMDRVFTSKDNSGREKNYKQAMAIEAAYEKTAKKLETYLEDHLPLRLKINKVVESGRNGEAKVIKIEGGENCKLEKGDKLEVVQFQMTTLGDGTQVEEKILIARLTVVTVDNTFLSTCRVNPSDDDKLGALLSEYATGLVVLTTAKKSSF